MKRLCITLMPLLSAVSSFAAPDAVTLRTPVGTVALKLAIEVKVASNQERYVYVTIMRADEDCCPGSIDVIVHVLADNGTDHAFPLSIDKDSIDSRPQFVGIGIHEPKQLYLELESAAVLSHPILTTYIGPIADDEKCFVDMAKSAKLGGLEGRKMMRDLIELGCVRMIDHPMQIVVSAPKTIREYKAATAVLTAVQPDEEPLSAEGLILTNLITTGSTKKIDCYSSNSKLSDRATSPSVQSERIAFATVQQK
jgi:hypothetical protein